MLFSLSHVHQGLSALDPCNQNCTKMEQQQKAPADIRNVAQFLRSGSSGIKVRVGALNGKRLDYFKGTYTSLDPAPKTASSDTSYRQISCQSPSLPCLC
jgi:hypothetical protein